MGRGSRTRARMHVEPSKPGTLKFEPRVAHDLGEVQQVLHCWGDQRNSAAALSTALLVRERGTAGYDHSC